MQRPKAQHQIYGVDARYRAALAAGSRSPSKNSGPGMGSATTSGFEPSSSRRS
jgi:hypothetical protein